MSASPRRDMEARLHDGARAEDGQPVGRLARIGITIMPQRKQAHGAVNGRCSRAPMEDIWSPTKNPNKQRNCTR